ncbi:hypothetical protein F7725_025045 [Dissostichus mawsoni]|uniref:Uncharacterized protein n=1 Tax=Dissostichus mawsoni TaxID=36200 RepID=A0A7J5XA82_DISMA|nr:hypothetical protein F7725_025045 [Dissostichus mawsoni]
MRRRRRRRSVLEKGWERRMRSGRSGEVKPRCRSSSGRTAESSDTTAPRSCRERHTPMGNASTLASESASRSPFLMLSTSTATYPYDDADSCHAGGGHDFGAVWDEVEQDGNDTFCSVHLSFPQQPHSQSARVNKLQHRPTDRCCPIETDRDCDRPPEGSKANVRILDNNNRHN